VYTHKLKRKSRIFVDLRRIRSLLFLQNAFWLQKQKVFNKSNQFIGCYSCFGMHFGYKNKKFSTKLIDFLDVKCSIQTGF